MTGASSAATIFPRAGAAAEQLHRTDWRATRLGPPDDWPLALVAHVRAMLHTFQPMCIFWGPELVNLYNDAFLPILGEKHPAAMGQRAEDCWSEAWSIVGPQLRRVLAGESIYQTELLVPIARGGRVADAWFNYSYSPLFDDDGRPGGVLVVCTDVTQQVTTRMQIEALVVQQSSARKQSDALRREAEAASRAKDEFLATVSHELRTPLTSILGWSRILKRTPDAARLERGLDVIERNARAQAKLIDDILDVSRIISGKLRLHVAAIDVAAVVRAAAESVRPAANAKGIELRVRVDAMGAWPADEDRLQQILWNLLSNAVKFTPAGGHVSLTLVEREGELDVTVHDDGEGIDPSFLPFVFDRFRQADASTEKHHAGLGLGLAIVRHLVELHGGTIGAESEGLGRGATFRVVLPRRASDPSHRPPPDERLSDAGGRETSSPGALLRGLRILVVDDQEDARALIALVLEDAGAEVVEAGSVADALTRLAKRTFDALVSDVGMPGEDGYALIARVRATSDVPALALTAFARPEDRARALESGFHAHLAKPIDPNRLVTTVASMLRR